MSLQVDRIKAELGLGKLMLEPEAIQQACELLGLTIHPAKQPRPAGPDGDDAAAAASDGSEPAAEAAEAAVPLPERAAAIAAELGLQVAYSCNPCG